MSLDIYLTEAEQTIELCTCQCCDNEHVRKYFRQIVSFNLTHNLGRMATLAGVYDALWRPDENGIDTAEQMIDILKGGIEKLQSDPEKYKKLNPSNGWGSYDGLLKVLREYLDACEDNPTAKIEVWR